MPPKNILFLCPDNAARSIMAEAYLRQAGRPLARAYSAGAAPADAIDHRTLALLESVGLRTGGLTPKSIETFAVAGSPRMSLVTALCDLADLAPLPVLPGDPPVLEWRVPDIISSGGRFDTWLEAFGDIRTLVDSLLFELPGVAPVRMPEVA